MSAVVAAIDDGPELSVVRSDVAHATTLVDIALDIILEIPVDEPIGETRMDRLVALLWAARDIGVACEPSLEILDRR